MNRDAIKRFGHGSVKSRMIPVYFFGKNNVGKDYALSPFAQ
jgi:hypothetical protein